MFLYTLKRTKIDLVPADLQPHLFGFADVLTSTDSAHRAQEAARIVSASSRFFVDKAETPPEPDEPHLVARPLSTVMPLRSSCDASTARSSSDSRPAFPLSGVVLIWPISGLRLSALAALRTSSSSGSCSTGTRVMTSSNSPTTSQNAKKTSFTRLPISFLSTAAPRRP